MGWKRTGSNSRSSKSNATGQSVALASVSNSESIGREFEIRGHRLHGKDVTYTETPNREGRIDPKYLVFHYTAGRNAQSSVNWLTNPDASASAHLVVGRDGKVT